VRGAHCLDGHDGAEALMRCWNLALAAHLKAVSTEIGQMPLDVTSDRD
jgi:hypothetical protein